MNRRELLGGLAATHLAAAGAGFYLAPRHPPLDPVVKQTGYFRVDVSRVLATTVDSLRDENRLLVFSYKGSARVAHVRTRWWLLHGRQELAVPAVVNYYLDLSRLGPADVRYDAGARLVTVRLPRVTLGDIAFQPEAATTTNGGVLTYSDGEVQDILKANYVEARRAMVAQAQQPGLVNAARQQAVADVQTYFAIPLRIAGIEDVRVVAKAT